MSTGDETVTLVIPEKTVVAGVKEVRVNDRTFSAYTRNGVVITLDDVATGDFDLVATIALKPSRGATALDDTICEDWYEGIEAGAKELLMIMPGKPWYNPELAGAHNRHYLGKVHEAKIKVNQKNDTTQNRVRMRPFI
ncbi:MAG: hypothetical protein GY737_13855 [Desulfobacteraceae bacterium]|nr:hypothetical protein [Desulfobacteraceae bacterium]